MIVPVNNAKYNFIQYKSTHFYKYHDEDNAVSLTIFKITGTGPFFFLPPFPDAEPSFASFAFAL